MKSFLALFLLASSFALSQDVNLKNFVWKLDEINIEGVSYASPENDEIKGVFLNILDSTEDTGYFSSTMCNFLLGNIQIEENQFYFTSNSNSDLDCQLDDNNSFDNLYFQNFYNNHINSPFQYSFYEENNWLFLTVTNSDLDTARYSVYLNTELKQSVWTLEKVIINDQEYFPPTELQNSIELSFPLDYNYKNIQTEVCDNLNGSVHISDSEITMVEGGHSILVCAPPIEDFDNLYMNGLMIHLLDNSFDYSIVNDSNILYLTLTDHLGNQAIYYSSNMSLSDISTNEIVLYPNPTKDVLYIKNLDLGEYKSIIMDASGSIVYQKSMKVRTDEKSLNVSNLKTGLYFFSLFDAKGNLVLKEKVMKE